MLDQVDLLDVISCPCCGGNLKLLAINKLKCNNFSCAKDYPIVSGIPILINENNSIFKISDFTKQEKTYFKYDANKLYIYEIIKKYLPSISHNLAAKSNLRKFELLLFKDSSKPRVLVIGGGIVGEGMKDLLNNKSAIIVESDVAFGPRTALIADSHGLPFKDNIFDGVVCQAVLEHVFSPNQCAKEIERVLKVGGIVYAETPFMQQVHGGNYDFTRFTLKGHRNLFLGFTELAAGITGGPAMAFAWSWVYLLQSFAFGKMSKLFLKLMGTLIVFPIKYLDYFLIKFPNSTDAASGFYFLGKKQEKINN
jgi:SAM-dependent methyltransferase